jgi:hypothetical protein
MTVAERIISAFGSQYRLARLMGTSQGTIWGWKRRGVVPAHAQQKVLDLAKEHGVALTPEDFFREHEGT